MTHALVDVYDRGARPPRRLRDRRAPRAAADRRAPLDPRARGRGAAAAAHLPRREVAGRPAALRPRRPARGGRRQHRQLRRGDVHGAGRHRQRRRSRRAPTPRRSTSPAPTSRATAARPPACSPRAVAAAMRPGRDGRVGRRRRARRGPRRHPRGDRGGRRRGGRGCDDWRAALARAARGGRRRSTRSGRTTAHPALDARRPEPHQVDRGAPDRARHGRSWPAATTARRCSAASTTAATADSIATMAGAITGALGGLGAVPRDWVSEVADGEPDRHRRAGAHDGRGRPRHLGRRTPSATAAAPTPGPRCVMRGTPLDDPRLHAGSQPEDLLAPRARRGAELDGDGRRRPRAALDRGRRCSRDAAA